MDRMYLSRCIHCLLWFWLACCLGGAGLSHASTAGAMPADGVLTLDEACVQPGGRTPPAPSTAEQIVTLPHLWSSTHGAYEGSLWYRFHVGWPVAPTTPQAVYVPKAIMNVQVWVNGMPMATAGSLDGVVTRNWYKPMLAQVPINAWRNGDNVVDIRVASGFASRNGLGRVKIGPLDELEPAYKWQEFLQVDAMNFANAALFSLGVFMVMAWTRDRDQLGIGFLGLSAVMWGMGITALAAPNALLLPSPWWEIVAYVIMAWGLLLMCLFFWRFVGARWFWGDVLVYGLMLIAPVMAIWRPSATMTAVIFGLILTALFISLAQAVYVVFKRKRRDRGWLLLACTLLVPAAAHDLACESNLLALDTLYMLPYVGPLVMMCIFYMLAGDYARSRKGLNKLNDNLASLVAQREQALRQSFERLSELERAQAVSDERTRILRDMHDGVGAHLTSALRQLQASRDQRLDLGLVTQTLRDSLDQLKLSIDALSLSHGDVVGLLASMRFRISPRLKAAGLELIWDVEDLPEWSQGHAHALRQLQYILFEGLSNALQHSGASCLTLSARAWPDRLVISLIDNGLGWGGVGEGQGVQAMRARAHAIGAVLEFRPAPFGGVELRLTLPLGSSDQINLSEAA